jgi:nicotinic acid mononucleotide adenylyltransferase
MEARSRPLARLADSPAGGLCILGLPPEPASATEVRVAVAQGDARAIEAYLEPTVAAYIARHGLYGQRASGTT